MLSGILLHCFGYIKHSVCLQEFLLWFRALTDSHERHYVTGREPTSEYFTS